MEIYNEENNERILNPWEFKWETQNYGFVNSYTKLFKTNFNQSNFIA